MQIQFNIPVSLGGRTYGKGQHSVPTEDAHGWFFDGLVKEGKAVVLREDVVDPVVEPVVTPAPKRRRAKAKA